MMQISKKHALIIIGIALSSKLDAYSKLYDKDFFS